MNLSRKSGRCCVLLRIEIPKLASTESPYLFRIHFEHSQCAWQLPVHTKSFRSWLTLLMRRSFCISEVRRPMKIRSRWLNLILSWTATVCLRLLFLSVRVEHHTVTPEGTPYANPRGRQRFTFSMWHDHIVLAAFSLRTYSLAGLISQHRDGSYLADSVRMAGIRPVRGSTSRGGLEAVREILSLPELHLAMTPDGPRGPRRQMKDGIIYISSRSGRPAVPCALLADRYWSVGGGWTNMIIPKPFSRVILIAGTPLIIPEQTPREELRSWADLLESEMSRLESIGHQILTGDRSAVDTIDRTHDLSYRPHFQEPESLKAA